MFTIQYKGFFIHGYCVKPECKFHRVCESVTRCRSMHAAKCLITRRINLGAFAS